MRSILATSQPVARESYITNLDGEIVQHVEYLPFGEVFIEERNNSWNTPYLFNGKELDEETGLYYYGARYYNPRESVWLSVDPLFEKTMTPYQYTYQNPLKYTDPTGMKEESIQEPTPLEAATMASHVYDGKIKLVGGWQVSKRDVKGLTKDDDQDGLKGNLYERTLNGNTEYAMVYAGTEDINKDGLEDILQVFGLSSQYAKAISNAEFLKDDLGDSELTFVGHSLGGGLAQASALSIDGRAITFNPAWLSTLTSQLHNIYKSGDMITNYVIFGELLNNMQTVYGSKLGLRDLGTTKYLYSTVALIPIYGPLKCHTIGQVLSEIKDVKLYNRTKK
jgi:RHS repeat-associated protein